MRVLVMGVSGSGKSYLVDKMKEKGLNAVDCDSVEYRLAKHVDEQGNEVEYDPKGGPAWWSKHYFVYDVEALKKLLKDNKTIYFFGDAGGQPGKGNGDFDVMKFFDKVYYLDAPKELIAKRLKTRPGNRFGKNPEDVRGVLAWKDELDAKVRKEGIPFIDATLPVDEIIKAITS